MRTIKGTGQYERDYKRETKGKSASYIAKLDGDLAAVLMWRWRPAFTGA